MYTPILVTWRVGTGNQSRGGFGTCRIIYHYVVDLPTEPWG